MAVTTAANFDLFNEAYSKPDPCRCPSCKGAGFHSSQELQGDPPMTGWVTVSEPCDRCIGHELCPGCMSPIELSFDLSAFSSPETQHALPLQVFQLQSPPQSGWIYDNRVETKWRTVTVIPMRLDIEDIMSGIPHDGFTCLVCGWTRDFPLTSSDYPEWDGVWSDEDDGSGWYQRPIPDEFQP